VTLILANAGWIGYITEQQMINMFSKESIPDPDYWGHVNLFFTICFLVELLMRLAALKIAFFLRHDARWNLFDMFVVISSLVELSAVSFNASFWRTMRMIRVVRVARVVRVLRFFSGLRILGCAIADGTSVLFWFACVMMFALFIFAIVLLQTTTESDIDDSAKQRLQKHWGSVGKAMLSLILALSGGISWEVLADELEVLGWLLRPLFTAYLLIIIFGVFNVLTAVFVERIMHLKQRDHNLAIHNEMSLTQSFWRELKGLFEDHGLTDDDMMDFDCFEANMNRVDVQMYLQTHQIDVTEAHELFMLLDSGNTGMISIDDFVFGCMRLKGHAKGMDIVLLYELIETLGLQIQAIRDRQHTLSRNVVELKDRGSNFEGHLARMVHEMGDDLGEHISRINSVHQIAPTSSAVADALSTMGPEELAEFTPMASTPFGKDGASEPHRSVGVSVSFDRFDSTRSAPAGAE